MQMTNQERFKLLIEDPQTPERIYRHMANGGTFYSLATLWQIDYCDLHRWMQENHMNLFDKANAALTQWAIDRLIEEIRNIAFIDVRKIFNEDGSLIPVSEWPSDIASALSSVDIQEIWGNEGKSKVQIGQIKKVKLFDKIKALEMLGKDLGRFVTKHEVTGKLTLEDLVTGSKKDAK